VLCVARTKQLLKIAPATRLSVHAYESANLYLYRLRRRIPVGYLKKKPQEPVEWGWANPAGGMFTSLADIAKVTLKLSVN